MNSETNKKRIAIIGGGFLGSDIAKSLDADMDVTLIERASHFTHAPAMIRALINPSLLDQALIPYEGLLTHGRVLQGEAVSLDSTSVNLKDGQKIEADYIVLATGSTNLAPFRTASGDIKELRANNDRWHKALMEANSVLIIGAGAVGTELAGEIAHEHPKKTITLVSSDTALFPTVPGKLGKSLHGKLKQMGVNVIADTRAENLLGRDAPEGGNVLLSNGQRIEAHLVIPAIGSHALAGLTSSLPNSNLDAAKRVQVDEWLRPSNLPNVFAAGDVAATGDGMTIVAISRQKPWLEKTLKALASGEKINTLKPYAPWGAKAPIIVPLGPKRGSAFLMAFTGGNLITRMMKGKDLFISKYRKMLGQK